MRNSRHHSPGLARGLSSVVLRLWRGVAQYLIKFGVVGLFGMAIDIGVFNALRVGALGTDHYFHSPVGASIVSVSCAIVFNWLGNRYWTFRRNRRTDVFREFAEYGAVSALGMGVALVCLGVSHYVLGFETLLADNIAKNVVGLALGTVLRFALFRYWVWGNHRGARVHTPDLAEAASAVFEAPAPVGGKWDATQVRSEIRKSSVSSKPATLIIIPTFNEVENIEVAVEHVLAALPWAHVLIVDDNSPDGTGDVADGLAKLSARVKVLHRIEKSGLGGAYVEGFIWAIDNGYAVIGEFDADGSHPAESLPRMFAAIESDKKPALVIGSRWVRGGAVIDWPKSRELLSRAGNTYARIMLDLPVFDATAGFRLFTAQALKSLDLDQVDSRGYCFQVDLTLRTHDAGYAIVEVPIEFRDRMLGESKMSKTIVLEAMLKVTVWGIQRRGRLLLRRR